MLTGNFITQLDLYLQPMKTPIFMLGLIVGLISCQKTQSPLTKEEAIAVIKKFDEGWQQKNLQMVDSVLAPVYIYFTQSGGVFSRTSLVETAGSPDYVLDSVGRMEFYVELYENTAVVSTRWQGLGVYKGVNFKEDQRCSLTIVKINDSVKILSEHCTPIRPTKIFH